MIKIVIVVKPDCEACRIVKKVIMEAVSKLELESTISIRHADSFVNNAYKVNVYPTTIFYRESINVEEKTVYGQFREIAKLEGSFPIDYLNKVIDKLKLECDA